LPATKLATASGAFSSKSLPLEAKASPDLIRVETGSREDTASNKNLEHDPENWLPVFPRDKREAFARRSCSNKEIERDDEVIAL
jgi:hypothetical protein